MDETPHQTEPILILPTESSPEFDMEQIVEACRTNPEYFYVELCKKKLDPQQLPVIESISKNRRTTCKGGNGTGKDFMLGHEGVRFIASHYPALVLFTAPTGRQALEVTWAEFTDCFNNLAIDLGGEVMKSGIWESGDPNHRALCFSTDKPEKIKGFHKSRNIFIGITEAQGMAPAMWAGIKTLLTAPGVVRLVLMGNPVPDVVGEFYMSFEKNREMYSCHTLDSRNASHVGEEFINDVRTEYGEGSTMWKIMVEGNFPKGAKDVLIEIEDIEDAHRRWKDVDETPVSGLGVDVADQGSDHTIFIEERGIRYEVVHDVQGDDPMVTAGHVGARMEDDEISPFNVRIDRSGVGSGTVARLKEQGFRVNGINFGEKPVGLKAERFKNRRAELYWNLRERFHAGTIAIDPNDRALAQELSITTYKITSDRKIQIVAKEEFKKKLGRSPDRADALALAAWIGQVGRPRFTKRGGSGKGETSDKGRRMSFKQYRDNAKRRMAGKKDRRRNR